MDRDIDEAQRYLEGVEYPVDKATLLSTVEDNGAPGELIERIEGVPLGEFSGPEVHRPRAWLGLGASGGPAPGPGRAAAGPDDARLTPPRRRVRCSQSPP